MPSSQKTLLALALSAGAAHATSDSPISKVVQMLSGLEAKIIKEGEVAHKEYSDYAEWCEDKSKELQYEIKTGNSESDELKATIIKEESNIAALTDSIDKLSSQIATATADLKAATEIRGREAAAFSNEEQELSDVLSALERAISILTAEMAKSGASMLQVSGAGNLVQAFSAMVEASMLSSADAGRLAALVQSSSAGASSGEDDDSGAGAPDAAVYQGQSGNIIDTLQGLKDKADAQLASARKAETQNLQNFQMLKQSLTDEIQAASNELGEAKSGVAASRETKEVAEGDLAVTTKDLAEDTATLADTHKVCMTTAEDFEAATRSRDEELAALAAARKAITENTGGADKLSYGFGQVSLLQVSTQSDESQAVVRLILDLARKQSSKSLAQLATRISGTIRADSRTGDVPFAKIKGLISDMIERLTSEGEADASHKAYCDKELHETNVKEDDKTAEISKLTTAIDQMTSRRALLQEEVATLVKELADLATSQAGYASWFHEFEATFNSDKADMEQGIEGVKIALKVLRNYYAMADKAHSAAEGAGANIIGLIEVAEADFTQGLAEMEANYKNQKAAYESTSKENEIAVTMKNQDQKYKNQEITTLTKRLGEDSSDRSNVQTELDAVMEYLGSLHQQCDEKTEPYAETKRRREAEIAGLKEALNILEGQAVFFQKDNQRKLLRGLNAHRAA